jgi:hypothetical protein
MIDFESFDKWLTKDLKCDHLRSIKNDQLGISWRMIDF